MPELIHHLKIFNRKERFILLHEALDFTDQSFSLGKAFRDKLTQCLNKKMGEIPRRAYVAMDYHLDWLQMALWLTEHGYPRSTIRNHNLVRGNQEDIDLLVAFADKQTTHLILIEAKGDTPWKNSQLCSKARRLKAIFGFERPRTSHVTPHFVLASPTESTRIKTTNWPNWMTEDGKPLWIELPLPSGLRKVTRCHEDGAHSADGKFLIIKPVGK